MLARSEYGTRLHILAWLAQQPPRAKFNWDDCTTCAVARYAYDYRQSNPFMGHIRHFPRELLMMNEIAGNLAHWTDIGSGMVTFGRLRRALEKEWGCCAV